jgi:hypothetical protein
MYKYGPINPTPSPTLTTLVSVILSCPDDAYIRVLPILHKKQSAHYTFFHESQKSFNFTLKVQAQAQGDLMNMAMQAASPRRPFPTEKLVSPYKKQRPSCPWYRPTRRLAIGGDLQL